MYSSKPFYWDGTLYDCSLDQDSLHIVGLNLYL